MTGPSLPTHGALTGLRADLALGARAFIRVVDLSRNRGWVSVSVAYPDGLTRLHAALDRAHLDHLARLEPWVQP